MLRLENFAVHLSLPYGSGRRYLRTKSVPLLVWIDDAYFTNFQSTKALGASEQFRAAEVTGYLVMSVFYKAGYFMSIGKCELDPTTSIVFLGVRSDSETQRFTIPEEKLAKLELLITTAIEQGKISFPTLEKVAGKCTSMSVACPAALLYTHFMYKAVPIDTVGGCESPTLYARKPSSYGRVGGRCLECARTVVDRQEDAVSRREMQPGQMKRVRRRGEHSEGAIQK